MTDFEQMTDYTNNLLPYLPPSRLLTLSCSHVIPPTNLLALPVSNGPDGVPFDFTFAQRSNEGMIRELGIALVELCEIVPDGLVVFFPSYGYLDSVLNVWKKKQQIHGRGMETEDTSIWQRLERRKKVFLEPKSSASSATTASTSTTDSTPRDTQATNTVNNTNTNNKLDTLLQAYSSHIHSRPAPHHQNQPTVPQAHQHDGYNGALLLAVINGSLSEGINFSDRLGRCVVVVGLPFPNASSAAWKAKLEYVGSRAVAANEVSMASTASKTTETHITATNKPTASSKQLPPASLTTPTASKSTQSLASAASRAHYTNACMRAVNQSIGRAIRHASDYGTILLFDSRWEKKEGGRGEELRGLLPGWIRESLFVVDEGNDGGGRGGKWEKVRGRIEGFFEGKRG